MAIVAVAGDVCTTTTVALAAAWPVTDDVLVVEADPSGGDLAAWFDLTLTPSLSTVVTRVLDGAWPDIELHTRLSSSGMRLIPAPARAAEAQQAVGESGRALIPTLASMRTPTAIVDTGDLFTNPMLHPFVGAAAVTVLVHRQAPQSAPAAAARLQRLCEQVEAFGASSSGLVVAIVGSAPFDHADIHAFIADSVGPTPTVALPVDELSASSLAGRAGVTARRLARLPLARAAADLATRVEAVLHAQTAALWRGGR